MEPRNDEEFQQIKGRLNGAWVLISGKNVGWPIDRSAREIHPCGDQEREQRDHEEKQ